MTFSKTRRSSGDDCSRSSLVIRRAYWVDGERSVSIPSKMRLFMALAPVLASPPRCYPMLVRASCVSRDGARGHHQRAAMRSGLLMHVFQVSCIARLGLPVVHWETVNGSVQVVQECASC